VKDQFFCGGNEPDAWNNPIDRSYAIDFTFGCQTSETVSSGLDDYISSLSILYFMLLYMHRFSHILFIPLFANYPI